MTHKKKQILFYVNSNYGIGHYVRTGRIARSLMESNKFGVTLIAGGVPFTYLDKIASSRVIWLSELVYWGDSVKEVFDGDKKINNTIFKQRKQILDTVTEALYDICIIEYFPFSKAELQDEVFFLINRLKNLNPNVKIICSLRDIIHVGANLRSDVIVNILNTFFDVILVHGDNSIFKLSDFFFDANLIHCPIIYTGFVTLNKKIRVSDNKNKNNLVVVSMGGGRDGSSFSENLCTSLPRLSSELRFSIFAGPFLPIEHKEKLQMLEKNNSNVKISNFEDYYSHLAKSICTISMAGYNTVYELVSSKIPTVLIPRQRFEQIHRAETLRNIGAVIKVNDKCSFNDCIVELLDFIPKKNNYNYLGIQNTTSWLINNCY